MKPIKSKHRRVDSQVRIGLGAGDGHESDLAAHSTPLDADALSEVAAYGKTNTCGPVQPYDPTYDE